MYGLRIDLQRVEAALRAAACPRSAPTTTAACGRRRGQARGPRRPAGRGRRLRVCPRRRARRQRRRAAAVVVGQARLSGRAPARTHRRSSAVLRPARAFRRCAPARRRLHRPRRQLRRSRRQYLDALAGLFAVQIGYSHGEEMGQAALDADARAALLHQLVVRAPPRDRARARARLARARRPEPRLLRLGRLGGGRVGLEARAAVPRRSRRAALEGRSRGGSPTTGRRWARSRSTGSRRCARRSSRSSRTSTHVRNTNRYHRPPDETEARVHGVPARRPRAGDRAGGAGHGRDGDHGAGAERRRLLHAARRLLRGRARALRPPRDPALRRRGDHRVRPARRVVRLRALRHPARPDHLREGPLVGVCLDRRRASRPTACSSRSSRVRRSTRTGSPSAAIRSRRRSRSRTSRS